LRQLFWPGDLCVLYPYRNEIEWLAMGISLGVLTGISIAACRLRYRFPYLLVGWLWFLGMLVPTIGLVQVGSQARADRFTYAAQLGVFLGVVWLIADGWGKRPQRWLAYAATVTGIGMMMTTLRQVEYWTNGATLFEHTVSVSDRNPLAFAHAGFGRAQLGDYSTAVSHYRMSLHFAPNFPKAWNLLTAALLKLNQYGRRPRPRDDPWRWNRTTMPSALAWPLRAKEPAMILRLSRIPQTCAGGPGPGSCPVSPGTAAGKTGEFDAAIKSLQQAAQLRPDDAQIAEALRKVSAD
jgi:tetratricopeptide (TPR) repeat protein